jgi:hypothetical protein
MVYIISTLLRKAFKNHESIGKEHSIDDLWKSLMLTPFDYGKKAIYDEKTRKIMEKISF